MQCSNCDQEIPFAGDNCPHCGADKVLSKRIAIATWSACGAFILIAMVAGIYSRQILYPLIIGVLVGGVTLLGFLPWVNAAARKADTDPDTNPADPVTNSATSGPRQVHTIRCSSCQALNDATAKVCNRCGQGV
jgi:hypothetical protein